MTDAEARILERSIAHGAVCRCDERSKGVQICPRHGRIDLYASEKTKLILAEKRENSKQ